MKQNKAAWYSLLAFLLAAVVRAGTTQVVAADHGAIVQIQRDAALVSIDLSKHVKGCLSTLYDQTTGERYPASIDIELLGESANESGEVLLLLASANARCSVQSQCGAGTNSTLVALQLDSHLRVLATWSFVVEDCLLPRMIVVDDLEAPLAASLRPVRGVLSAVIEQRGIGPEGEVLDLERSRLTFNLRDPASGFIVTKD